MCGPREVESVSDVTTTFLQPHMGFLTLSATGLLLSWECEKSGPDFFTEAVNAASHRVK